MSGRNSETHVRRVLKSIGNLELRVSPQTLNLEVHHSTEWQRLDERSGPMPTAPSTEQYDKDFPPLPGQKKAPPKDLSGKSEMLRFTDKGPSVNQPSIVNDPSKKATLSDVHVQNSDWGGAPEARLRIERKSTEKMRADMTKNVNARDGVAKESAKSNCAMAKKLTSLLDGDDGAELLKKGGLLNRIVGKLPGQGQHDMDPEAPDPKMVIKTITDASDRLAGGQGTGDDANKVLQFIGCFVDGLTEVVEVNKGDNDADKKIAKDQFDKLWPKMMQAFGLTADDKDKLLARVDGYKEIAGGASDTLSGKGTRKGDTRAGLMPNDPRYKIKDDSALIKGDISGSMHSQLLAQELAETLTGNGPKIKDTGDDVVIKDRKLLDARAIDALALTAGGRSGENDRIFHTAYEMINGMRAISGAPEISQPLATEVMELMEKGQTFSQAMYKFYPKEMPWLKPD